MSVYIFEYTLPKKYFLRVVPHYEDTDLTRAYLYKTHNLFTKLVDIKDYNQNIGKLDIVKESIDFSMLLEEQRRSMER